VLSFSSNEHCPGVGVGGGVGGGAGPGVGVGEGDPDWYVTTFGGANSMVQVVENSQKGNSSKKLFP